LKPTMKVIKEQIAKWFIYNVATFALLAIFYLPYNIYWLGYSGLQLLKWFLTAGFFGSIVNIIMRPYVAKITHYLDKRYSKKVPEEHVEYEEQADNENGGIWLAPREKK
jgi:hypothetical protein